MNWQDITVYAVLAACVCFAVLKLLKSGGGSSSSCSGGECNYKGGCSGCGNKPAAH